MPRARAPRACAGRAGGAHPGDKEEGNTVKRAARAIVLGVLGIIWVLFVVVVTLAFTGGIHVGVYKPVLYVYPEREQSLTVSLDVEGELGTVYPAPDALETTDRGTQASWTVTASPDGTLTDQGGRTYPSLFWDGEMTLEAPEQGFIVAREDAVPFLEEKLALLGLTDKEAADFITFWAPRIRANEYTFVSFDASSYTAHARYSFTDEAGAPVEPDTFIRVFMTIRAADANEEVTPQVFGPTPTRSGFTAVEWGGTEQ